MNTHVAATPALIPPVEFECSPVAAAKAGLATLGTWHSRWVERRKLEELGDDRLRDAGLSRAAVMIEARRPFWQR
jgi:uncharacterized protein YjiS (DUF1127 family)